MAIKYERGVAVTPALARKWLAKNAENNRRPKEAKIAGYARDMAAGKWDSETGETIKFNESGELIDGQNRLAAVIMSEATIEFDVAYGASKNAMKVIDTGAARSSADVLKILGVSERMRASAIVRWVIMWDSGIRTGTGGRYSPTTSEIADRFLAEPGLFDAATHRGTDCSRAGLGNGSAAGVAFYLFAKLDQEEAHGFFDQFISGIGLPEGSPVLALRNKIPRARLDRLTRAEQLALFVRAWNACRNDELRDRLMVSRGDLTNANFPQPI